MPDVGRRDHKVKGYRARYYHRDNNDHYYYRQNNWSHTLSEDWDENDRNEGYEYENNQRREEESRPTSSRVNQNK